MLWKIGILEWTRVVLALQTDLVTTVFLQRVWQLQEVRLVDLCLRNQLLVKQLLLLYHHQLTTLLLWFLSPRLTLRRLPMAIDFPRRAHVHFLLEVMGFLCRGGFQMKTASPLGNDKSGLLWFD